VKYIPRQHTLHSETLGQLTDNSFDAAPNGTWERKMLVRQNGFHVLSQRGSQVNALFLVQALGQKATNVSFVPQNDSNDSIQDLPHGLAFIRISSRHGDFSDDAAAGDRDVSFEAIELQLFSFAVASGSQPFEESSTRGSIDVGNDHGKAIHDMNGFFQSTHEPDDGSMHLLVEYPKVGTLADEARTISQVGKKCRPVTREVFVNGLIILVSQEFANDHHRDDFTVGKIGIGPPGAELVVLSEFGDKSRENIVNEGVDKDEEFIYGEHGRTSWFGFGYLQGGAPVSFVTPLAVLGAQVGPNLHGSYLNPPTQQTLTLGIQLFSPVDGSWETVSNPFANPITTTTCYSVPGNSDKEVPVTGVFDRNGDGLFDYAKVRRDSSNLLSVYLIDATASGCSSNAAVTISGLPSRTLVFFVQDMTGDGKRELMLLDPSTMTWTWRTSNSGYTLQGGSRQFGDESIDKYMLPL
jgi:hypothetical protein